LTVATAVVGVTGARPSKPDVSARRKPPTKRTTMIIQMYFAEARIACSKALLLYELKGPPRARAERV
jgi:hypothetical protein